jgi:hypothetical protein
VPAPMIVMPEPVIATPEPVVVTPAPLIVTPEPVVLPKAEADPEADLVAQMHAALAALDERDVVSEQLLAEANLEAEPKLELVTEPTDVEPKLELVDAPEPVAELKLELAAEPASAPSVLPTLELAPAPSEPAIPSLNGRAERISLRSLPELSLSPSAPVTMPRPAPVARPALAVETPVAAAAEPRVSFKDLASALLGPTAAVSTPVAQAAVEALAETAVVEPVSPAMAQAVAELEPALTVEALINSTLPAAPAAHAEPEAPAAKKAEPEKALPVEFAGLQFPKDGVMTRQWMEFLSQMSNTK